jgi:hypothetical protein
VAIRTARDLDSGLVAEGTERGALPKGLSIAPAEIMPDEMRINVGVGIGVRNMKAHPRVRLLVPASDDRDIMNGHHGTPLPVLDLFEASGRKSLDYFLNGPLDFRRHSVGSLGIVVIRNGVEAAFVRHVDLLVVCDLLVWVVRTEKIEQKIQLNLHVLGDGRFLDLKACMAMPFQVYRAAIDMNVHLEMMLWMKVMMKFGAFRRLEIGFHWFTPIAKSIRSC